MHVLIFITDAENAQWTLAPKQTEDTVTCEEREPPKEDGATTAEEPQVKERQPKKEDVATAATDPQTKEGEPKLSENDHSVLYGKLAEHSAEWREIGTHLGFRPSELNEIQARPLLLNNAPKSWLSAMLADWLQWAPGDQRDYATLEALSDALNKVGLSKAATEILKPTA